MVAPYTLGSLNLFLPWSYGARWGSRVILTHRAVGPSLWIWRPCNFWGLRPYAFKCTVCVPMKVLELWLLDGSRLLLFTEMDSRGHPFSLWTYYTTWVWTNDWLIPTEKWVQLSWAFLPRSMELLNVKCFGYVGLFLLLACSSHQYCLFPLQFL